MSLLPILLILQSFGKCRRSKRATCGAQRNLYRGHALALFERVNTLKKKNNDLAPEETSPQQKFI